jgi:cell wall-associated NlpC family hydrolase
MNPRTHARWLRLLTAALAGLSLTAGLGSAAAATPSPAELERQIDAAWNKLEPIIEQYNMVHAQLTANKTKAAKLNKRLAPLQLTIQLSGAQLGETAAHMYMGGGLLSRLNALLSAPTPADFADKMTMLELIARAEQDRISGIVVMRDKYAADKTKLDAVVAELASQDAALAGQKRTIEKQIAALQKLRQQAYGSSGTGRLKPVACPVDYLGGPGGTAAKKACSLIGKPYIWGAAGPDGYDCSGLTLAAWKAAGVTLRHYTKWQWQDNAAVSRANLRPGDLVFFFSDLHHMGLYVGGGWMVHAPTTGDFVRMAKIDSPYLPIAGFRRPS